jgi:DNA replication protein DnaC
VVNDQLIMQAVSKILQRSERQADLQKLLGTFVDVGILPQLLNRNNQILYGRRGTGKTHVLRVLASRLKRI